MGPPRPHAIIIETAVASRLVGTADGGAAAHWHGL